jgi:hypothetical protein
MSSQKCKWVVKFVTEVRRVRATEVAQSSDAVTTLFDVTPGAQPARTAGRPSWYRILPIIVLAIVVGVIVWLIVKGDDENNKSSSAPPASAAGVDTLRSLPGELGHDVYWAGRRAGFTYELTQVNGNIYIRYLPAGISLGDPRPNYLTVGTYPKPRSFTLLQRQARQRGNESRPASRGGIAVWSNQRPQSVYVAYPRSDVQVEVYTPSAPQARRLATSGAVTPIR